MYCPQASVCLAYSEVNFLNPHSGNLWGFRLWRWGSRSRVTRSARMITYCADQVLSTPARRPMSTWDTPPVPFDSPHLAQSQTAQLFQGWAVRLVDTARKTLNHLKDYLARFWQYYQTSPALQKALANA